MMYKLYPNSIQPKLRIGQSGDAYEKEADAVADRVMRISDKSSRQMHADANAPKISMKCQECEEGQQLQMQAEKEEEIQMKPEIQRDVDGNQYASSNINHTLNIARGNGQALPEQLGAEMGNKIGSDFSNTKIHTDSQAIKLNKDLGAQAFTHGNDIYFNQGKYNPSSSKGKHLLAHELTHVVQQRKGESSIQRKCDTDDAIDWYKTSKSGTNIIWTQGLVEELYKVVGAPYVAIYASALAEEKIAPWFITLVCQAQTILGFTGGDVDGKIGPNTIKAWEKWKTGGAKGINYTKLLKDKKLEIGIAIGQDFHSTEFISIETVLTDRGLKLSADSAAKKTYTGKKKFKVQGDNTAAPVEIDIIIDLVSAKSTNPKQTFSEFLTAKEITIYSGHARYGTGPDFDPKASMSENFVIGVNSALHKTGKLKSGYKKEFNKKLKGMGNDLEKLSKAGKFDPSLYQVWFMNACSTANYLDEVRKGLVADSTGKIKSKKELRFMGTKHSIYSDAIPIVKGILDMKTMEEIVATMDAYEKKEVKSKKEKPKKSYYFAN